MSRFKRCENRKDTNIKYNPVKHIRKLNYIKEYIIQNNCIIIL